MASSTPLYRNKAALRARLQELPTAPGVYRFYDVTDTPIYIGKSVCLRDRVRSYFSGRAVTKKLRRLRQEICRLDWEETGSELEALLLESRLVKRHLPRFNVMLRTCVPLSYLRVDLRDPYPRLEVTRAADRDGATYFGPFRSHAVLETAAGSLSDALQLRNCDGPGERLRNRRPCYRHEFGSCAAPCLGLVPEAEYRSAVDMACAVFEGREESALQIIRARMERAADGLQFEIAARLRDALRQIQSVAGRQQALVSAVRSLSLVAACPSRNGGSVCLFVFRCGRLVLDEEVPHAVLESRRARKACARRLLDAGAPARGAAEPALDSTLLDEIQIITNWMKQKAREGDYWEIRPGLQRTEQVAALDAWLAGIPAAGAPPKGHPAEQAVEVEQPARRAA